MASPIFNWIGVAWVAHGKTLFTRGEKDQDRRKDEEKKKSRRWAGGKAGGWEGRKERKIPRIKEESVKPPKHTTKIQAPNPNLILSFSLAQQIANTLCDLGWGTGKADDKCTIANQSREHS